MQSFLLSRIVSIAMWWPWWLVAEWLWDSTGAAEWEWDWERDCWMRLRVGLLSETESGTAEWEWDCWMRVRVRMGLLSESGTAEWEWDCWVRLRVGLLSESGTAVWDWEWDCWVRAGLLCETESGTAESEQVWTGLFIYTVAYWGELSWYVNQHRTQSFGNRSYLFDLKMDKSEHLVLVENLVSTVTGFSNLLFFPSPGQL